MRTLLTNIVAAAVYVAVCGQASAQDISLRLLHTTPVDLYQALNEGFLAGHNTMRFRSDPAQPDYDVLTQNLLRGAIAGDLPDVVFQGYNRARLTIERGVVVPLDKFILGDANLAVEGYPPAALEMCALNGKPYGLPFATSVPIVYYNLDLVAKAGRDPHALPSDWNGILALARDIKAASRDKMAVFFDYATTGNWTFQALLASFGGQMMTADGGVGFDNEAGQRALSLLAAFRDAGQVDMSRSQAWQTFSAGGLGILISTSSLLPQFEQQSAGNFQVGTGAFPMTAPNGRLPAGGNCAMIMTKDPTKQRAAWEYIRFASGPFGQTIVAMKSGYIPMNTQAVEDPALLGAYYKEHPNYLTAVKQVPILTRFESFPGDNSMKLTTVINDHLRTLMLNQAQPHEALAAMTKDVKALLRK
ncbi:extracellular solute-binding protein [Bradyrhizobium sp. SSUT77]|uniref:extracellular solute-binding protein n=1 Tax=Bradyrhizobium sp. SSUT77 TaxID=3040603 RepID=UPI00244BF06D|nr:extracellular solute-binding protein [Bradyrhizobium sp. SSUT77]MDH2347760.1 extracellular solute-binding protein [Bradyrhizobium sp. SSUT77]